MKTDLHTLTSLAIRLRIARLGAVNLETLMWPVDITGSMLWYAWGGPQEPAMLRLYRLRCDELARTLAENWSPACLAEADLWDNEPRELTEEQRLDGHALPPKIGGAS